MGISRSLSRENVAGWALNCNVTSVWKLPWLVPQDRCTRWMFSSRVNIWECKFALSCLLSLSSTAAGSRSRVSDESFVVIISQKSAVHVLIEAHLQTNADANSHVCGNCPNWGDFTLAKASQKPLRRRANSSDLTCEVCRGFATV